MKPEVEIKSMKFGIVGIEDSRLPHEWKVDAQSDVNIMIGYASTFSTIPDLGGDIIVKGAFAKTIQERVAIGHVPLTDGHGYDGVHILGVIVDAREDDYGLLVKCRWSTAPSAQDTKTKVVDGSIWAMSIGFNSVISEYNTYDGPGDWSGYVVRTIKEIRLGEIAVTAFPMNEGAEILAIKSNVFFALPLAENNTAWDEVGATARVSAWAKTEPGKLNAKSERAYLGIDRKSGAGVCMIGDIIDGELKAVPRAIRILGSQTVDPQKKCEVDGVLTHLSKYYSVMGDVVPCHRKSADLVLANAEAGIVNRNELEIIANRCAKHLKPATEIDAGPVCPPATKNCETENNDAAMARLRLAHAKTMMAK